MAGFDSPDTFYQFGEPMMVKLGRPTLYCHDLEIDEDSRMLTGWKIRLEDQKRVTVEGLRNEFQHLSSW